MTCPRTKAIRVRQRAVFKAAVQGVPYKKIGAELGVSAPMVRSIVMAARNFLCGRLLLLKQHPERRYKGIIDMRKHCDFWLAQIDEWEKRCT